jgi:hypothetical protein
VKDKYGSDAELDDEYEDLEEAESEDEDGEELTPVMDVAILKTLAKIKNKDPEIYDSSKNVFEGSLRSSKCQLGLTSALQNNEPRPQIFGLQLSIQRRRYLFLISV